MTKRRIRAITMLIVAILIILAGWLVVSRLQQAKQPAPAKPPISDKAFEGALSKKLTVLINEGIFGPAELKVKKGNSVVWTNLEATTHQVVTDDTKTVTAAKSPILAQGKSYSHTFTAAGTFRYHDNLHPDMQGTITVE